MEDSLTAAAPIGSGGPILSRVQPLAGSVSLRYDAGMWNGGEAGTASPPLLRRGTATAMKRKGSPREKGGR